MAKKATKRGYAKDKEPTCSDAKYRGISFGVPASVLKQLPIGKRASLSGRVVDGKFVIDQGSTFAHNVFVPKNVCWWEEVRKAKAAAKAPKRKNAAKRRAKSKRR